MAAGHFSQDPPTEPPRRNRQWRLARHIEAGELVGRNHFTLVTSDVPDLGTGEILVRTHYLGTSPAQRSYISRAASMHDKVALGEVMHGRGVGQVVASRAAGFQAGDIVTGPLGWQDYAILTPQTAKTGKEVVQKLTRPIRPLNLALSVLGQAGFTAYFGLLRIGALRRGECVVISSAAGGVGSIACQIAKRHGCRTIGITGSAEKCRWLTDRLGIDVALNYKTDDIDEKLGSVCPEGVDVYFDNVGGTLLNTVLKHLAVGARVVISGWISTFDDPRKITGPSNYIELVRQRARMEGLFVFDFASEFPEAQDTLLSWHREGLLHCTDDIDDGLEALPDALAALFTGANRGVKLVRVAPDPA